MRRHRIPGVSRQQRVGKKVFAAVALALAFGGTLTRSLILQSSACDAATDVVPTEDSAITNDVSPTEDDKERTSSKQWNRKKNQGQALRDLMLMFTDVRVLDSRIDSEQSPQEFWRRYEPLLALDATATFINHLPEAKRREVKGRLANVCSHLEGVAAKPVEASDWSIEQRRYKHENVGAQGKTGLFVALFKQILDLIYGRETLEKAMEAGREKHRVQELLKEYGVYEDIPVGQVDTLIQELAVVERKLPGSAFEIHSTHSWPNPREVMPEDVEHKQQKERIIKNFLTRIRH